MRLQVFGGLSGWSDRGELDLGGRRQRGVLALLLLARGSALSPERLADLLWGEAPPPGAQGALQSYVSHLRRAFEPDRDARARAAVLVRERAGYACRLPDEAVDAWRFEQLVRAGTLAASPAEAVPLLEGALALYRGDAYSEWSGSRWADAECARLRELRDVGRERLLGARLDTADPAVLVPELEALTAEEPLREERWRLLALALYRAQRQSDALGALRRARRLLADELGVDPGPALRELEARILAQDAGLDAPVDPAPRPDVPAARQAAASAGRARPAQLAAPEPGDLADRDAELAALRAVVADALAGAGGAVVVEGPAGIGKSRLLVEARRMALAHDALVLSARGSALEREYGFGVVRQLVEPLLLDPPARARLLAGAAAPAAAVFDDTGAGEPRADGSFAALHGLYWLVVTMAAERPLVLAVDDLHWCDAASLRFLAYLARRLEGLPVLLVTTLRTGETGGDPTLVDELTHDPVTLTLSPGPLGPEAVGRLVADRLGGAPSPAFVAACHRTTGGNPLLLRQLVRALEQDGVTPDTAHADTVVAIGSRAVSSIVVMRLGRLPAHVGDTARAVAVLGEGASLPAVASLARLDEQTAADAVADLSRTEILRPEPPLGFVHPLVRDAVYRSIAPGHRVLAHERAARVLDERGEPAERVAAHLLQVPARADAWVVRTLRRAAAIATDRGAAEGAAAYLARALAEPPESEDLRATLLLELGQLETLADAGAAVGHLEQAYALAADPGTRARAAQVLAHTLVFGGERGSASAFARRAAADLPPDLGPASVDAQQALVALDRVGAHMHGLPVGPWPASPAIEGDGAGARMLSVARAWELMIAGADRDEVVALCRAALRDGVLQRTDPGLFWVVAAFLLEMADEDLGEFWDDMLRSAHQRGSLFSAMATHMWRGHSLWHRGDLPEAEQSLRTAIEQIERWGGPPIGTSYGEGFVVAVLLDRGRTAEARAFFDSRDDHPRMGDGERLHVEAEVALLLAEDRPAEALARLERAGIVLTEVRNPVWSPWRSLRARALTSLGRGPEAEQLLAEELAAGREWGSTRAVGRSLRLLGGLRGAAGVEQLREAVTMLEPSPWRLELARARYALALVSSGAESVELLTGALQLATACGADGLAAQAASALAAAGAGAPVQVAGSVRLTTTQRRVATMAAAGADPLQIAASLFLTPHSVETALGDVRAALGVASDAELRLALAT
ncbi:putative ATPase [Motilibacter peucedani]|uniref:Putative ATPase n=1 Tax=Motilibacter peucedani TaxID=598650 RepID=A0A420XMT5_9ACTN|nr:putative ATPase [Motilibacter peucedani]